MTLDMNQLGVDTKCINSARKFKFDEMKKFRRKVNSSTANELLENLSALLSTVKSTPKNSWTEPFMLNVVKMIGVFASKDIVMTSETEDDEDAWKKSDYTKFKITMSKLWSEVMKWDSKTQEVHKIILRLLPEKIIRHLSNPLHTSDYLVSAFDFGGPLSLYSLKGIFVLMTNYNLEVPDFYTRLYSLFKEEIFEPQFRTDFFQTVDIFLMSSHLPEQLVAAFVKKLSRLSLLAPTPSIIMLCAFIQNLMVRHPGLETMVHTKTNRLVSRDPFSPSEKDPINSRAIESCLWEIKTLQNHFSPEICRAARFIDKPIGKQEIPWMDYLALTYDDVRKPNKMSTDEKSQLKCYKEALELDEGSLQYSNIIQQVIDRKLDLLKYEINELSEGMD